jgi:sphinganine-1-phosphate aldolase
VDQVDVLLGDLDAALTEARALTPVRVDPGLAELAAGFDPLTMGPDEVSAVLAFAGLGDGDGGSALPDRMAPVLVLLDALPAPLKERLLTEFVGSVFRI